MSRITDKLAGKAKQAAGKLTDDKKLQAEGKGQELKGAAQDKMNEMKASFDRKKDGSDNR